MREIKFRAWDKEKNRFFEPTNEAYNANIEQLYIGLGGGLFMRTFTSFAHESTFPDRFIVQRFTGLKDKNGKEIYEGDIVEVGWFNGIYDFAGNCVIAWNGISCGWEFESRERGMNFFDTYFPNLVKIIGNIYENKELL